MLDLILEPVRPEDKEEVLALCRNIWGGQDYIPYAFDEWVKEGGFYCGRLDGKIVALDRYSWHEGGVLWLEGFRVHPDFQGTGIGSIMSEKFSRILEKLDCKVMRSMTAEINVQSIHLAEKKGFHIMAEYSYLSLWQDDFSEVADTFKAEENSIRRETDASEVIKFVMSSPEYEINRKQYLANWVAYDMTEELVRREVEKGNCFSFRKNGKMEGIAFFYPYKPYNSLSVAFMAGSEDSLRCLMRFGLKKTVDENRTSFSIKTASPEQERIAEEIGLHPSDIGKVFIYEKQCKH